jgi:small-conductance mechanosensitive channel
MLAKVVKRIGAWGLVAFAALFGLFAAGYAFEDPGGWAAVGLVALYVVPAVLLAVVAWRWPQRAMVTVVPVVAVIALAWVALPLFPEAVRGWFDDVGPVFALATGVAAVALAVLGLHRPGLAGTLLIAVAAFVFVQLVLGANAFAEGPGPFSLLETSGGVMVLPMVISGSLLLTAYELERHEHWPSPRSTAHPAPA